MRAAESRNVIKNMQQFMDNLDQHVLNRKIMGKVKVKHVVAAFCAFKMLQGFGKVENAETTAQIYAGGLQAIVSMGGAFGMVGEKNTGGRADSERTTLNALVGSAAHFMVSQAENGEKLYNKDGKYMGTVVNRYDENGKITASVPVYQIKEGIREKAGQISHDVRNLFMNRKRQNG